jgi:hypothetical protein
MNNVIFGSRNLAAWNQRRKRRNFYGCWEQFAAIARL